MLRCLVVAVVALSLVSVSACTLNKQSRPIAIGAGVAMIVAGAGLVLSDHVGSDDDDVAGVLLKTSLLNPRLVWGMALVSGGSSFLLSGLRSADDERLASKNPPRPAPLVEATASATSDAMIEGPQLAATPPAPRAALPELPATPEVLRLAQQIRSAATRGKCNHAWTMWSTLQARDAAYADALADSAAMSVCVR